MLHTCSSRQVRLRVRALDLQEQVRDALTLKAHQHPWRWVAADEVAALVKVAVEAC